MKELKSKILKEFDFRNIDVSGEDFTYETDKNFIEKEITRIKKKNKISYEVQEVTKGDIVICSLKSSISKFNKENISINVGLGLYDRQVEDALIGMEKGESKILLLDNESINIDILNISRSRIPELTDEMVEKEEINSVSTVESLINYLEGLHEVERNKAIDSKAYLLVGKILKEVIEKSEFVIYEEDIEYLSKLEIQRARVLAKLEGLILEDMTPEEFSGRIPVQTYEDFLKMIYEMKKESLPILLLGLKSADKDVYKVSKENYNKSLNEYSAMYNIDPEDASEAMTFEYYEAKEYQIYYENKIKEYFKGRYKEV